MSFTPFSKVFLTIGPFKFYWYGLMYVVSIFICYFFIKYLTKTNKKLGLNQDMIWDILFWTILGVIIGARIGYVFIYNFNYYWSNPGDIFALWKGGMSFHGGLIGAAVSLILYLRIKHIPVLPLADIISIPVPLSLALGRIGNFINGELYGRITNLPWCMHFHDISGCRHPSQIYESFKNLIIFFVLYYIYKKKKLSSGTVFSLFLILYGSFRFLIEFVREPEIVFLGITMGQWLSSVMTVAGITLLFVFNKKKISD